MGRHKEFEVDEALDAAMCVFWKKGYEGASYNDLTEATGVERPALYSAFGNKEALFLKALHRYYEQYLSFFPAALDLPSAYQVAEHILRHSVELNTRDPNRAGCLAVQGVLAGSDDAEPVRQAMIKARMAAEGLLRQRFEKARSEGDLPKDADCAALATYVCAVTHGMAVQAKAGYSRKLLDGVVDQALKAWPAPRSKKRTVAKL